MPPDPVGQLERSRARPPILGARPVLARLAPRCAPPMPPDPVGQLERSRARPPILGARPVLAPFGRCAPPMPPDPVGQLERSRARPPILGARPVLAPSGRCAPPRPPVPLRPRPSGAALLRCPQTPSAGVGALALGLRFWGPVRCSRPSGAALLRCPQTPSAGVSALALGLRPLLGRASSRGLRPVLARYVGCESNASAAPPRARGAGGRLGASRRRPPPSFWPARCAGRRPNSRAAPLRAPDPVGQARRLSA